MTEQRKIAHIRMLRDVGVGPEFEAEPAPKVGTGLVKDQAYRLALHLALQLLELGWAEAISLPLPDPPRVPDLKPPPLQPVETAPPNAVRSTRAKPQHDAAESPKEDE